MRKYYAISHTVAQLNALRDLCEAGLWHGTTAKRAKKIKSIGTIRASNCGFFGPGVYLTSSKSKAEAWARYVSTTKGCLPAIVRVKANIGRCKIIAMGNVEGVHDMCVQDYADFHFNMADMFGRPFARDQLEFAEDPLDDPHPVGNLWLEESFDSQYIPETWPGFDEACILADDPHGIWPDAMKGDELILRHEFNAEYISHKCFS